MKKMGYTLLAAGVISAGVVGYCLLSKDTKRKANRLLNSVVNDVAKNTNKINNQLKDM